MIKKWKALNRQEKWMIVFIILLVIAIITRWGYIKSELSDTVSRYFESDTTKIERPKTD